MRSYGTSVSVVVTFGAIFRPTTVASPYTSTVRVPLCPPVAVHATVDPGAGLNACVFLAVTFTVAVPVVVVNCAFVNETDHFVIVSVILVQCHP